MTRGAPGADRRPPSMVVMSSSLLLRNERVLTATTRRYVPDHDEGGARDDALVGGALQQGGDLLQLLAAHVDRLGRVRREGHVTVTRITSHKSQSVLGCMSGHVYVARHSNTCHREPLAAHVGSTPPVRRARRRHR